MAKVFRIIKAFAVGADEPVAAAKSGVTIPSPSQEAQNAAFQAAPTTWAQRVREGLSRGRPEPTAVPVEPDPPTAPSPNLIDYIQKARK